MDPSYFSGNQIGIKATKWLRLSPSITGEMVKATTFFVVIASFALALACEGYPRAAPGLEPGHRGLTKATKLFHNHNHPEPEAYYLHVPKITRSHGSSQPSGSVGTTMGIEPAGRSHSNPARETINSDGLPFDYWVRL